MGILALGAGRGSGLVPCKPDLELRQAIRSMWTYRQARGEGRCSRLSPALPLSGDGGLVGTKRPIDAGNNLINGAVFHAE